MRKVEFYVPAEVMAAFADELTERNLSNEITGRTEDGEVVIEVSYARDEADQVDELEDALEKLIAETREDEEDED